VGGPASSVMELIVSDTVLGLVTRWVQTTLLPMSSKRGLVASLASSAAVGCSGSTALIALAMLTAGSPTTGGGGMRSGGGPGGGGRNAGRGVAGGGAAGRGLQRLLQRVVFRRAGAVEIALGVVARLRIARRPVVLLPQRARLVEQPQLDVARHQVRIDQVGIL